MSEKKLMPNKPPVPARPKNLVVLNSKHLPKPPETFPHDNVTNFIKDLNLDVKDEGKSLIKVTKDSVQEKYDNAASSDGEEDAYGYLEPVSLAAPNSQDHKGKSINGAANQNKSFNEESFKFSDILHKIMLRNSLPCNVPPDDSKSLGPQNQWQRPLPLPPKETKLEVTSMPWYKNIDRKKGEEILQNGVDGYFLVRPSSNVDTYLTLTLWYSKRVYNIPIRKRKDGKFALGTPKTNEQCFDSVECMVKNYQSEKLVLYSNGVQTGKTLLTTYPL